MAKVKQHYGLTPWGKAFYERLVAVYDDEGRLTRGKTYFTKGSVQSLNLQGSMIHAKVKGSGGSVYRVSIAFEPFDAATQPRLIERIKGDALLQSALLNGTLPETLIQWCEAEKIDLFTTTTQQDNETDSLCSCPDYENPCKHIFAVLLALSTEIDHNPLLLFSLHGLDLSVELESLGGNEIPPPIVFVPWESTTCEQPLEILHHENAFLLIDSLLLENPSFAPIDYKAVMREFYKAHTKSLPHIIAPIVTEEKEQLERFFKDARCECKLDEVWQNGSIRISHPLLKQQPHILQLLAPYMTKQTQEGCLVSVLSFVTLFLSFHSDEGDGAAYRYYHALSQTLYLLLHANAFIPTVVKDHERPRFFIGWIPLLTPASVREQIQRLACYATPFVRLGNHEAFANGYSGTLLFLSKAMGEYVYEMNFMHKRLFMNPPPISQSFFQGRPFVQKEGGKSHTDRAVYNYFSVFSLALNPYSLTLTLDKGEEDHAYGIALRVHDDQTQTTHYLCDALKQGKFQGLLKLLALLRNFLAEIELLTLHPRVLLEGERFETFIKESSPLLSSLGISVILPRELRHLLKPRLAMRVRAKKSPTNFLTLDKVLEYDWTIAIGDTHITLEEFQSLVEHQSELVLFRDSYISISPEELKALFARAKKTPKLSRFDLIRGKFEGNVLLDTELEDFFDTLFRLQNLPISPNLKATLRPYQIRGVQWCISNLLSGFGIILADDMGLGKTIQTIATLLYLYEQGEVKGETLIVVPTSLLPNWENELGKFAPSLSVELYYGIGRILGNAQIILTTYDIFRRDEKLFSSKKIEILVIDEAQRIKNPTTQAAMALKGFKSKFRIALSGTPVENSLTELWSIFDFALPEYLKDLGSFVTSYVRPIEMDHDHTVAENLKALTAPFMLRRLKTDKTIIDDLPDKIVVDEYATLLPDQAALYQSVVEGAMKQLDHASESKNRAGLIFKLITELKQICNHPRNYDKTSPTDSALSGKSELLLTLLEPILARGEKVLIFTQYVEMLAILTQIIETKFLIEPLTFEGSMATKAREAVVDAFQNDPKKSILILSLKAGGVGLNLTQAANVIHYDLWFNPAVENQATDRAFRIGQKNNVFVYRFITKNSFEEKIDAMIKAKTAMGEMSVSVGETALASLNNDELKALFVR
ncbi:MAG: DEAD/DEAH box helicase [Sulfuricurvum sp.]